MILDEWIPMSDSRLREHSDTSGWRGNLACRSHFGFFRNSLCGDEIWIDLLVNADLVMRCRFLGQGCMVSQACASMLCEGVEGKTIDEVLKATPEELMEFEIRELTMNRQRCALIAYEALMNALSEYRADNMVESSGENDSRSS